MIVGTSPNCFYKCKESCQNRIIAWPESTNMW